MPGFYWGSPTGSLVNEVITEAPRSSLSEKVELYAWGVASRVLGKQVKWSTQESPSQIEHLISPKDPRVPLYHITGRGGALFAFCWVGGMDRNKMALQWPGKGTFLSLLQ